MAPIPHKIRFADDSSDRLTIAQKQRFVNRQNAAYSTGDTDTKTTMEEAFSRAKELRSTQETDNISNRDMLANAFETLAQNSEEYKMIQKYKNHIRFLILVAYGGGGKSSHSDPPKLTEKIDKTRLKQYDFKLFVCEDGYHLEGHIFNPDGVDIGIV